MRAPATDGGSEVEREAELRRLGELLGGRTGDVLERVVARTRAAGHDLDAADSESFERVGLTATASVARWMAGADPRSDAQAGREAWEIFGHVAALRAVPLHEVTKRCLRWRDAIHDELRDIAAAANVSATALQDAMAMAQRTLDVTLVRMCEAFESERERAGEELMRHQRELAFLATHDALTGLANRALILERAERMLGRTKRAKTQMAALVIDLDNFTAINDTFGHAAGDALLKAIASRLDGVVRDVDVLGRLGGDEFVALVEGGSAPTSAGLVADRLRDALKAPFELTRGEHELKATVTVTASIGVASGRRPSAEDFLRDADIAMHRAKWEGKNRHVVFEPGMQDIVQSRMELEMDLRVALEHNEFFLLYQPTFDLGTMRPTGAEALVRWRRPLHGVVAPNDFIPLLEETGLIVDVGRWVLGEACRQGARWHIAGHHIGVAVNVSGRQLETDQFIADVDDALRTSGFEPGSLTLEITETVLTRNPQDTARRLRAINDLGVRIAIDDFGTGYSSFAHLKRFPVDSLKIDRSFISQLAENPEGETLLRTLVQLGKALSIETLAEGIEHEHQLTLLQEEHCDSGQGFLFARPLSVEDTERFLVNWSAEAAAKAAAASASGSCCVDTSVRDVRTPVALLNAGS